MSLVRADGLLRIPSDWGPLAAGEEMEAELLRPKERIDRTLWVAGGHDPVLEILESRFGEEHAPFQLSVRRVEVSRLCGPSAGAAATWRRFTWGMGGMARTTGVGSGNCSRAGGDPPPPCDTSLGLARRSGQSPGPFPARRICSGTGMRLINRQEGSGTRLIFPDRLLRERGIDPSSVNGYARQVLLLNRVAAAVAEGSADVGLGTRPVAQKFEFHNSCGKRPSTWRSRGRWRKRRRAAD